MAKTNNSKVKEKKADNTYTKARDYVFNFIKDVIDKHGPRLPGSQEEREAADTITIHMKEATGKDVVREPFNVAPIASIGAIPLLGMVGLISTALYYINPWISLVTMFLTFFYAIVQVFLYKGWFDRFWKQHESQNLYSVIDGGDKIDYTIVYSGHMDSSWNWNHSEKAPQTVIIKLVYFIVSMLTLLVFSLLRILADYSGWVNTNISTPYLVILTFLPIALIPGLYIGARFLSWDKTKAAPGAMDNLSGVGISIYMGKYFKENPEKLPANCRIVVAALGSEEAGLKGSLAFTKKHVGKTDLLINPISINLDGFSDYEHFGVISGDVWQMTTFSKELIDIAEEKFTSLKATFKVLKNPVGGCDSTPFCKLGIPTLTICAQNPVPTNYYHTLNDKYERLDQRALTKGIEGVVLLTEEIFKREGKISAAKK